MSTNSTIRGNVIMVLPLLFLSCTCWVIIVCWNTDYRSKQLAEWQWEGISVTHSLTHKSCHLCSLAEKTVKAWIVDHDIQLTTTETHVSNVNTRQRRHYCRNIHSLLNDTFRLSPTVWLKFIRGTFGRRWGLQRLKRVNSRYDGFPLAPHWHQQGISYSSGDY